MPTEMELESGEIIEIHRDVIIIPKQDVEFSDPPQPKTEKARTNKRDRVIASICKEGFGVALNNSERRYLVVDEGLGIGVFRSLEEIQHYVKKGYPAADIERYKSALAAKRYPRDFHKLPPEVRELWDKLPEEAKQAVRENGADFVQMKNRKKTKTGERVISPNPNFQPRPEKLEKTKEAQKRKDNKHLKYIYDSGFHVCAFFDRTKIGIKIDSKHIIGMFSSFEDAYRYLKEGHHTTHIGSIRQKGDG